MSDGDLEKIHADLCKRAEHTYHTIQTRKGGNKPKATRRSRKK
jgi:hypothetical protein